MAPLYQINLTMSANTVNALGASGYSLYGLQAVQSSAGGSPTVWFQTGDYSLDTSIEWTDNYQAYTSRSEIIPQGTITATASYPVTVGQTLTVSNSMGLGEVANSAGTGAVQQGISFINQTSTPFTCGIDLQQPGGGFGTLCAFSLFGNNMGLTVPTELVFLMFSTVQVNTGAVLENSYGPGILINLAGANTRSVGFDINQGWSWTDAASWAQSYPANQNLVPLLIQPVNNTAEQ